MLSFSYNKSCTNAEDKRVKYMVKLPKSANEYMKK